MRTRFLIPFALLLPLGLQAQAGQVVGPMGSFNQATRPTGAPTSRVARLPKSPPTTRAKGSLATAQAPSSLSLTGTPAQNGQYPDWGFYYRYAESPAGFGSLAQLSELSFDWFREGNANSMNTSVSADWAYKTPSCALSLKTPTASAPS